MNYEDLNNLTRDFLNGKENTIDEISDHLVIVESFLKSLSRATTNREEASLALNHLAKFKRYARKMETEISSLKSKIKLLEG